MNQDLNDENLVKRGILIRVGGGRGVEIFSKINKWGGHLSSTLEYNLSIFLIYLIVNRLHYNK